MLHILAMLPAICPLPETIDTPNAPACNSLAFACAVVCSLTRTGPCAARAAMWATVSCGSVRPNITLAPLVATGARGARLRGGCPPPPEGPGPAWMIRASLICHPGSHRAVLQPWPQGRRALGGRATQRAYGATRGCRRAARCRNQRKATPGAIGYLLAPNH